MRWRCTGGGLSGIVIVPILDRDGNRTFTEREHLGQGRRLNTVFCAAPDEPDGRQAYEFDTYAQLPRDLRPKPRLGRARTQTVDREPEGPDRQASARRRVHVGYGRPATASRSRRDWGVAHFVLLDQDGQDDRERQELLDAEYRQARGIPYPLLWRKKKHQGVPGVKKAGAAGRTAARHGRRGGVAPREREPQGAARESDRRDGRDQGDADEGADDAAGRRAARSRRRGRGARGAEGLAERAQRSPRWPAA